MKVFSSKKRYSKNKSKGFTLIEMMVAVAIFSVLMAVSLGALVSIIDANAKSQALKSVINNLNFALESMAKTMRVGTSYHCGANGTLAVPQDCSVGDHTLAFEGPNGDSAQSGDQIVYRFNSTDKDIERSTNGGTTFVPVTAPEVIIEDMTFYTIGSDYSDGLQPKIVITVRGYAGIRSRAHSEFNLQTTVSQRLLDS